VPEFSTFDQRGYRTVPARPGYGAWRRAGEDRARYREWPISVAWVWRTA
jgi:hypothetical protein